MITLRAEPVAQGDCLHCGIREQSLFAELTSEDYALIDQPVHDVVFTANSTIFDVSSPGAFVYMLRHGLVKLVRYEADGTARILRLLMAGDVAGIESLAGNRYGSSAIALSPVAACRMPVAVVRRLEARSPRVHAQLLRKWHEALRQANDCIANLGAGTSRQRVARLLVQLAHGDSAREAFLPTREDIGAMLGLTTETVSRTTASFAREGLLKLRNRRARIAWVDVDGLEAVAHRVAGSLPESGTLAGSQRSQSSPNSSTGCIVRSEPFPQRSDSEGQ